MNAELFGVFGDQSDFTQLRSPAEFDRVLVGNSVVVGIRDPALGDPGRTTVYEDQSSGGISIIYGDAILRNKTRIEIAAHRNTAAQVYTAFLKQGFAALGLDQLNGSYLAVLDTGTDAFVATDPLSSRECFYTDTPAGRIFGTDISQLIRAATFAENENEPDNEIVYDQQGLCEFLQFGVVFSNRTVLTDIRRVPFDGCITSATAHDLSRFVYDPQEFDFVSELAARLEQAIRCRGELFEEQANRYPDTETGLLLSAGFDSRAILAALPPGTVDVCYTLGSAETPEVCVAVRLGPPGPIVKRSMRRLASIKSLQHAQTYRVYRYERSSDYVICEVGIHGFKIQSNKVRTRRRFSSQRMRSSLNSF